MPTALEMTREQWAPYLAAARRRTAGKKPTAKTSLDRERLLSRVRDAAAALKTRMGAERVVLFGSLARAD